MGFFSWCCAKCSQPVLSVYAVERKQQALCQVVLLLGDRVITGTYDGYGRVDDCEIPCGLDPVMLHRCCYGGERFGDLPASAPDPGQGFFYGEREIEGMLEAVRLCCAGGKPEQRQHTPFTITKLACQQDLDTFLCCRGIATAAAACFLRAATTCSVAVSLQPEDSHRRRVIVQRTRRLPANVTPQLHSDILCRADTLTPLF